MQYYAPKGLKSFKGILPQFFDLDYWVRFDPDKKEWSLCYECGSTIPVPRRHYKNYRSFVANGVWQEVKVFPHDGTLRPYRGTDA